MNVAITGASGLIGKALAADLERDGHGVVRLVRNPSQLGPGRALWQPDEGDIDAEALSDCQALVHLAGENIAGGRWTESFKQRVWRSRVDATQRMADRLACSEQRPEVIVAASAIGFYGDRGDQILTESTPPGQGFLPDLVVAWEEALQPVREAGIRVVHARLGVVLSAEGGALPRLLKPMKLGLGGRLGKGDHYMSWVSLTDVVRALRFAIESPSVEGPVNVVAPKPVTNAEFTKTLADIVGRPAFLHAPAWVLRTILGDMAEEMLLASARVAPEQLSAAGFEFADERIGTALRHILDR